MRRRSAFVASLFSLVLVVMAGHESEHVVQLIQKDGLGQQCPQNCKGLLGTVFDTEPVHFVYNVSILVLLVGVWAFAWAWRPQWRREHAVGWWALTAGTALQVYHVVEHSTKLDQWLTNGHHSPTPGLLGKLLPWHGITLVELHFALNTAVFVLVVAGFVGLRVVDQIVADGRAIGLSAATIAAVLLAVTWPVQAAAWATDPPTVHLAAGIHQGPIVISSEEHLIGAPGAVVRGGIVVRANHVVVRNVSVLGGEYGIEVDGARDVLLDRVKVVGATLDGIHVRRSAVTIRNCTVDSPGRYTQGIDISFGADMGMSTVEGCTVVGGKQGIVVDSALATVHRNRVSTTSYQAIAMTEMSMGMIEKNEVQGAVGAGIACVDQSECMITGNRVTGTRGDETTPGLARQAGYGIVSDYKATAELAENELLGNAGRIGVFAGAEIRNESG